MITIRPFHTSFSLATSAGYLLLLSGPRATGGTATELGSVMFGLAACALEGQGTLHLKLGGGSEQKKLITGTSPRKFPVGLLPWKAQAPAMPSSVLWCLQPHYRDRCHRWPGWKGMLVGGGGAYLLLAPAVAADGPQVLEGPPEQDDEEPPEEGDHGRGEEGPPHALAGVAGHLHGHGDDERLGGRRGGVRVEAAAGAEGAAHPPAPAAAARVVVAAAAAAAGAAAAATAASSAAAAAAIGHG